MKLMKAIIVPVLILGVTSSLIMAEEGLLSRILPQEKKAEEKADASAVAAPAPAQTPAPGSESAQAPVKDATKCPAQHKGMKTCEDPTVEEVEEQIWVCQTCPCVIIVKKAGICSLHHCGKPMCLKEGKGAKWGGRNDKADAVKADKEAGKTGTETTAEEKEEEQDEKEDQDKDE